MNADAQLAADLQVNQELPDGIFPAFGIKDPKFAMDSLYFRTLEEAVRYKDIDDRADAILARLPNWENLELLELPERGIGYVQHPRAAVEQFWSDFIAMVENALQSHDFSRSQLSLESALQLLRQMSQDVSIPDPTSPQPELFTRDRISLLGILSDTHAGLQALFERAQLLRADGRELVPGKLDYLHRHQGYYLEDVRQSAAG